MAKEIGNWGKPSGRKPRLLARKPADLFTGHLGTGEKLIWSAAGGPRRIEMEGAAGFQFIGAAFVLSIIVPMVMSQSAALDVRMLLFGGAAAIAVVTMIVGYLPFALPRAYALTNRRIIIRYRGLPFESSYAPLDLDFLRVRGAPARGDIIIRYVRSRRPIFALSGDGETLSGVESPLKVAELIRKTLAPHLEVEQID